MEAWYSIFTWDRMFWFVVGFFILCWCGCLFVCFLLAKGVVRNTYTHKKMMIFLAMYALLLNFDLL